MTARRADTSDTAAGPQPSAGSRCPFANPSQCEPIVGADEDRDGALRRSESQLRAVLETAIDAIITINDRGVVQSANPATERMFGYAAAELLGRNVSMLMPEPFRSEHDEYLARYRRTGERRIIGIGREVQAMRRDGTVFPIDLAVSETVPSELFTGVIRDISDRKSAELRLREADRMATIGTLAAGLGHDMNNVLLPVRAHLNALKASGGERGEHVDKVRQGVDYLQQLADGLHFLAMDPDQDDAHGGSTDLHAWWKQTGALLRKAVPRHVKVSISMPSRLAEVAITAHALTQAMLNLIVNAGEAVPAGRKRRQGLVRISAATDADGSSVRLTVTDNGCGMTEEVRRRAFDMFFTTKPRGLGTGLGLAMVKKAVDRAGGSIDIQSSLGKGTSIALLLPTIQLTDARHETTVFVQLTDRRAESLIRGLLEAAGAKCDERQDPGRADLWLVEPARAMLARAKSWRKRRPRGRLVLFGNPDHRSAPDWDKLSPVIIREPDNLDDVRAAIGRALAANS